jgi:hypothetical protein
MLSMFFAVAEIVARWALIILTPLLALALYYKADAGLSTAEWLLLPACLVVYFIIRLLAKGGENFNLFFHRQTMTKAERQTQDDIRRQFQQESHSFRFQVPESNLESARLAKEKLRQQREEAEYQKAMQEWRDNPYLPMPFKGWMNW